MHTPLQRNEHTTRHTFSDGNNFDRKEGRDRKFVSARSECLGIVRADCPSVEMYIFNPPDNSGFD
jgi:hypothetical protein